MSRMPLWDGDPSRIGRYRLTARLGAGGMGVVYLGTTRDGGQAAIKVLRPELADDPEFRARFRREVTVLSRVQGLCTVAVIEADTESPRPFLATEYADGPSLAEHVARHGPLGREMLFGLAAGLAEALAAIHAAGVTHRDLKPGNVLLTPAGPKVIDFGIAQTMDATAVTRTGITVGSPGYMAPEQVMGQAGQPADIFSWALTVAYAASGQPPYGTGPTEAVLYRIIHGSPDISAVPAELQPLVQAALAKNPADRPGADDLLRQLTASTEETAHTRPTQVVLSRTWLIPAVQATDYTRQTAKASRRRPLLLVAGAAVLAAVVGATAALLTGSPAQRGPSSPTTTPTAHPAAARTAVPSTQPAATAASSATPPASPTISASPTFTAFAGGWTGHGRSLTISGDGSFTISARTYQVCGQSPPPCDPVSGNTITDGDVGTGQLTTVSGDVATGVVTTTTDPADTPTGPITMTLDPANDTITENGTPFCGPKAPGGTCGA